MLTQNGWELDIMDLHLVFRSLLEFLVIRYGDVLDLTVIDLATFMHG